MSKPVRTQSSESPSNISAPESPKEVQRHFARDDFEFGSLLGIGALAQVIHVRDTFTGEEYALKILDKKQLKRVCLILDDLNRYVVRESGADY